MLLLSRDVRSSQVARLSTVAASRVKIFYNDVYEVVLPPKHRFPMQKYKMVREIVQQEYKEAQVDFQISPKALRSELISTHCPIYVDRYMSGQLTDQEVRKTGFPRSGSNVDRALSSVGGTVAAMRAVLGSDARMAAHLAGGTHHAFRDYGEGFCIFSDIAVAANLALQEFPIQRVLIIDLDVHQGNGNAKLFQEDPRVFTFSMHCRDNYFSEKQQSNIDIELEAGVGDDEYLSKLKTWLPYLFHSVQPQLVFFQAGVDIYEGDRLGKLKVTRRGLQQRNQLIFQYLTKRGVDCVVTMGGG
ncbi:histone deacetylase family protein [Ochromonadaceae sp. CCMP2298]|nr:histone deacetylase family protein [Ochromonadaceae sp. CCMP2298]